MSADKDLFENSKVSVVDKFALFCALAAIACVLGAHGMDKLARDGDLPTLAFHRAGKPASIDATPTASIPNRAATVQLNPCAGAELNRY
jgi:hypothetical protein